MRFLIYLHVFLLLSAGAWADEEADWKEYSQFVVETDKKDYRRVSEIVSKGQDFLSKHPRSRNAFKAKFWIKHYGKTSDINIESYIAKYNKSESLSSKQIQNGVEIGKKLLEDFPKSKKLEEIKKTIQVLEAELDLALAKAAEDGNFDEVKELLKAGAKADSVGRLKLPPIMAATKRMTSDFIDGKEINRIYIDIINELVKAGATLDLSRENLAMGQTALYFTNCYFDLVKFYIEQGGANPKHKDLLGLDPLYRTLEVYQEYMLNYKDLLDQKRKVLIVTDPVGEANMGMIERKLSKSSIVISHCQKTIEYLIGKGGNVNTLHPKNKLTPMRIAKKIEDHWLEKILLKNGAEKDLLDDTGILNTSDFQKLNDL